MRWTILLVALFALLAPSAARAAAPPWCGTPETDASLNAGGFDHIPYYAIGCTLRAIQARSYGRMDVRVIGTSVTGRDLYGVVINRLRTPQERRDWRHWVRIRREMLRDPVAARRLALRYGDAVKVPVFIQGGIHGNEYEGVDAAIDTIERFATAPYGEDATTDAVLDHLILVFNPIQNPDGRVLGRRANGNGFDLNRDYLTQSQPETIASIGWMKRWLAPDMLDMHGYETPTLIEATTKPHNPSVEYDHWLEWNQPRTAFNAAALADIGEGTQRPVDDWCPDAALPGPGGKCSGGGDPGPDAAEGWDDWGPFYGPMYHQLIGLNSSTVEMCDAAACGGRAGARRIQNTVQESTFAFDVAHRAQMLGDELVNSVRGKVDAPRPRCCPAPLRAATNDWMQDFPQAYVIPFGAGQRSDAEANRLVEWLLFNDVEVERLQAGYGPYEAGSYVVWMAQPRRGLADTALGIGVDVSPRIQRLYAPPAAWSHGYLWGADTVTIAEGAPFSPRTAPIHAPNRLHGGVERGTANAYALAIDSPTAVRALNDALGLGARAALVAGRAAFAASSRRVLDEVGRRRGLTFSRVASAPASLPIDHVPRIAVLSGAADQSVWVLRDLGFAADPVAPAVDSLAGYDVIFNTSGGYPGDEVARSRLAAFFSGGGGYIGGQRAGADFLVAAGQVTGLTATDRRGNGRSGIVYWDNEGGASSPITGTYPARDTAIVDPPTWLTAVPSSFTVDARLPASDFFAAGLWPEPDAGGQAIIAHGPNADGTARLAVFANNPLYRADPEREWPMLGGAVYWTMTDTPR